MTCTNRKGIANVISNYLGLVETIFDHVVDKVKMELAGATTIKRDRVVNELVFFMVLVLMLMLMLVLVLVLVLDKTKGLPLVEKIG